LYGAVALYAAASLFDIFGAVATSEISFNRLKAGLKAFIHAISRQKQISLVATARFSTRAVLKRQTELRRLKAIILAISRQKQISLVATALKAFGQSTNTA
jgi:hypothetical protein